VQLLPQQQQLQVFFFFKLSKFINLFWFLIENSVQPGRGPAQSSAVAGRQAAPAPQPTMGASLDLNSALQKRLGEMKNKKNQPEQQPTSISSSTNDLNKNLKPFQPPQQQQLQSKFYFFLLFLLL
jgi:hypothetical protein